MLIIVTIINIISLFFLICGLNTIRLRYKIPSMTLREKIYYRCGFLLFNFISFLLCFYYWNSVGYLIWINLTSINAFLIALGIGFYSQIYIKWINFAKKVTS